MPVGARSRATGVARLSTANRAIGPEMHRFSRGSNPRRVAVRSPKWAFLRMWTCHAGRAGARPYRPLRGRFAYVAPKLALMGDDHPTAGWRWRITLVGPFPSGATHRGD